MAPVADQQERGEAGELPEHQQHQHVVREHDAEHRALEQQQIGVEPAHRVVAAEIPARVDDDQQADDQDQGGEEQAVAVDEEAEIEAQLRDPGDARLDHLAAEHRRGVGQQQRQGGRRHRARDQRAGVAAGTDHQRRQDRAEERQEDDQGEAHPCPAVSCAGSSRAGAPARLRCSTLIGYRSERQTPWRRGTSSVAQRQPVLARVGAADQHAAPAVDDDRPARRRAARACRPRDGRAAARPSARRRPMPASTSRSPG